MSAAPPAGRKPPGTQPPPPVWAMSRRRAVTALCVALAVYFSSLGAVFYLAAHNAAKLSSLCMQGNEFRREQYSLWNFVIDLSQPRRHESAAAQKAQDETAAQKRQQKAELVRFEHYLHKVLAPRNCNSSG